MGQHADLVPDLQRQVQRDADVLVDAPHVQEAGFEVQHPLDLSDGLARQLGVGNEEPQIVQLAVAAPEGVAHVLAQHLFGLGHALGVHAGDQHHVTQLQRPVHLGRMGLTVAIDGRSCYALRQPAGQLQEGLAHDVAVLHTYRVHLQRNALLRRDPWTEEGVVQADDQDRDGHTEWIGHRIAGGRQVVAGQCHGRLQRGGAGAGAGEDAQRLGQRDIGEEPDCGHRHEGHDHHADDRGSVGPQPHRTGQAVKELLAIGQAHPVQEEQQPQRPERRGHGRCRGEGADSQCHEQHGPRAQRETLDADGAYCVSQRHGGKECQHGLVGQEIRQFRHVAPPRQASMSAL